MSSTPPLVSAGSGCGRRSALERQRLVVGADEGVLRIRAIRALHPDRVHERLAHAPLALGRRAIEQIVIDRREQTAEPTKRDLREREDARGLVAVGAQRRDGHLLFLERVVERVARHGRWIDVAPAPLRPQVGDARESRQRAVEG